VIGGVTGAFLVADWYGATRMSCQLTAEVISATEATPLPDSVHQSYPEIALALDGARSAEEGSADVDPCQRGEAAIRAIEEAGAPSGGRPGRYVVAYDGASFEIWLTRIVA